MDTNETMSKRLISRAAMILLLMLLTTASAWAWTGNGTSESPYQITSADDLNLLATDVNGGQNYNNVYFLQTAPIELSGEWTPIGTESHPFKGHYDGGNFKITNLNVSDNYQYAGLFGYITSDYDGAYPKATELKNINIVGCTINVSSAGAGNGYAGGIAGYVKRFNMSNCKVSGTIDGYGCAGGLIGRADSYCTMSGCFADVTVSAHQTDPNQPAPAYCLITYYSTMMTASGNYYHNVAGISAGHNSTVNDSATRVYSLTGAPSGVTVAETNATLTFNATPYFAAGATTTLTVDDAHKAFNNNFSVSGTGSSYTLAGNKRSATVTIGSEDATVNASLRNFTYTVVFNGNGSTSGSMSNQAFEYSVSQNLTTNAFSRTGYTYNGWNTKANGSGTSYTDGQSVSNLTTTDGGTVNLYAQWTAHHYSVRFNGNGSTSGSMSNQGFTYDVAQNLTNNAFTRAFTVTYNYNGGTGSNNNATATATFNGWATSAGGSKVYNNQQSVSNLTATNNGIVDLYANWTDNSVTLPTPTKTGYTFAGWYSDEGLTVKVGDAGKGYTPNANISLYAKWTLVTYTITYNLNGGSVATANPTTYDVETATITLNNPTKTGYTFLGWYTNSNFTGTAVTTIAHGSTGDVELWAKWGIPYIDADGNTQYCLNATVLTSETDVSNLSAGWYVVYGNVSYNRQFYSQSAEDIHLILGDGAKMTVECGEAAIFMNNCDLTIYAQSTGSNMGQLVATSDYDDGIYVNFDDLIICGGNITATTKSNNNAGINAGISVTIHGGQVSATGNPGILTYSYSGDHNITLGLRNATDYIYASSYGINNSNSSFKYSVKDGQVLTDEDGNTYSGTLTDEQRLAIGGKTLYRYIENLDLAANQAPDQNYWTTFYCGHTDYQIDDTENACAYTATYDAVNSQLMLHNLGKQIPKNTAVIIVADNDVVSMTATTVLPAFSGTNDLRGVDVDTQTSALGTGTFYVLGMTTVGDEQHFGFHRYTATEMPARKAFVHVAAAPGSNANARALTMVFDDATAIQGLTPAAAPQSQAADHWFTLDGRRLQAKPTAPGIYVNNGKKVVIK